MNHSSEPAAGSSRLLAISALIVALAALALVLLRSPARSESTAGQARESALERMRRTKVIRAGYSGFKPYTIINPNETDPKKRVTGFCVDMLNEIAARQTPPWTIEWSPVTFESLKADMESGRFDVFADAVYQTGPRALDFGLTEPFGYFGVAAALVKKDETRFNRFEDLDRADITISVAEGWTSTEYARSVLKKPKFKGVSVGDDPFVQLQDVIAGRADVALQDVPTIALFARAHAAEVKALWLDRPPTRVAAGFMTPKRETELIAFLNAGIRILQVDGTMDEIDRRWNALNEFPAPSMRPGSGLPKQP